MDKKLRVYVNWSHSDMMTTKCEMDYDEDITFVTDFSILSVNEDKLLTSADLIIGDELNEDRLSVLRILNKITNTNMVFAPSYRMSKTAQLEILSILGLSNLKFFGSMLRTTIDDRSRIEKIINSRLQNIANDDTFSGKMVAKREFGARGYCQYLFDHKDKIHGKEIQKLIKLTENLNDIETSIPVKEKAAGVNTLSKPPHIDEYDIPCIDSLDELFTGVDDENPKHIQLLRNMKDWMNTHHCEFIPDIIAEYRILGFYGEMCNSPGVERVKVYDDNHMWSNLNSNDEDGIKNKFHDHDSLLDNIADKLNIITSEVSNTIFDQLEGLMKLINTPTLNIDLYIYKDDDEIKWGIFEFQQEGAYIYETDWRLMKILYKKSLYNLY